MFRVHRISQRPNLRHLGELLGGAKDLLEAVSYKKVTEDMGRGTADANQFIPRISVHTLPSVI